MTVDELWQTRAAAWELAALSLRYPGAELAGAAAGGEWNEAAGEILAALGLSAEVPAAAGEGGCEAAAGADALLHALRPEATRLFVGAPGPACSPYEGVWAAEADGVQPLLFVNPRSMEVERFMRSCGLGRPEGTNEPLDHVATECELLEHLALRRPTPTSPAAARPPPTGGSSPGTPKPGCPRSPSAWPPRRAIPSTARRRPTWGRWSIRTLPNRPIPAILPRASDQVK